MCMKLVLLMARGHLRHLAEINLWLALRKNMKVRIRRVPSQT